MLFKEYTSTLRKCLKEATYAHQGCIYLIKLTVQTELLQLFNYYYYYY